VWFARWRAAYATPGYTRSLFVSIALFMFAFVVNLLAIRFATAHASNSVTDLVLSNTPVFDVDGYFVYGTFVLAGVSIIVIAIEPKQIPFTLKALAVFWIIRSGFTSLTHVAPFPAETKIDFGPTISKAFFGGDRFFSGHVGMPFLGALAFWEKKWVRYLFLAASVYFAAVVLMGHLHYSIDVAAAFFITYGILDIAKRMFPSDHALFLSCARARS
jgi:hypothetical protein